MGKGLESDVKMHYSLHLQNISSISEAKMTISTN